jgi:hypothetical protein
MSAATAATSMPALIFVVSGVGRGRQRGCDNNGNPEFEGQHGFLGPSDYPISLNDCNG